MHNILAEIGFGRTVGASMYDVRKNFGFFDPLLHPCHIQKSVDFVPFVCFFGTPTLSADVIYGSPLY